MRANKIFNVVIAVRFRRTGENHTDSVQQLLQSAFEGRVEIEMQSLIITADRGYAKK